MPTFSCPQCNKSLKTANPIPAGKKVKCPGCSHIFRKPAAPIEDVRRQHPDSEDDQEIKNNRKVLVEEDNDEEGDEAPSPISKKKKASGKKNLFLTLGGVAVLLLLLAVAAFVWPGFLAGGKR